MNVLLCVLCWTTVGVLLGLGLYSPDQDSAWKRIVDFATIGGFLNGMLALFNLLPLPPFDGASIVAGFSRTYYRWMHDPRIANIGFFVVLVAMFSGVAGICANASDAAGLHIAVIAAKAVQHLSG